MHKEGWQGVGDVEGRSGCLMVRCQFAVPEMALDISHVGRGWG